MQEKMSGTTYINVANAVFVCWFIITNILDPTSARCPQPIDCQDVLWSGRNTSGVYTIYPQGTGRFKVYCDMTTAGGGWTVLQRRMNGNVGFNRFWREYQYGFGNIGGEHWIGNQRIHQLTSQGWYELRVDMTDFSKKKRFASYRIFSVGNKSSGYRLTVGEYEGNAGDSLTHHNGCSFHTRDRDINTCSYRFKGGWWYRSCHHSNLNGTKMADSSKIKAAYIAIVCWFIVSNLPGPTSARCQRPIDCQDVLWSGRNKSGVYTIYPQGTGGFKVYCDMTTVGGGWTVLQRRMNGIVGFNRSWREYQYGFGNMREEHWIGNQRIHQLTSQGWYELRVEISDFNKKSRYAYYRIFSVGNKVSGYRLSVGEYEGNAGDSLAYHSGSSFYAKDRDINNCSYRYEGGWWYNNCHGSNLNGLYLKSTHSSYANGVNWYHWHTH